LNHQQIMEAINTMGPVLSLITGIMTIFFGAFSAVLRYAWKLHEGRMTSIANCLTKLTQAVDQDQKSHLEEASKIWQSIQGLRAELHLSSKHADDLKAGILKLEGTIDGQRATLYQHIEKITRLDSKLEAVFRVIDAPRRSTDAS